MTNENWREEVRKGQRYRFGRNWQRFGRTISEERRRRAEASLEEMLGRGEIRGRTFLDAGCGSGLFSLAARELGTTRVHSFDFDADSVSCTRALKDRFRPDDTSWTIEEGSVLDTAYLQRLGQWDVVYSWGVLHHTGRMWTAFENIVGCVAPGGRLFISIYNDQGAVSERWRKVKRIYVSGLVGRVSIAAVFIPAFIVGGFLKDAMNLRNPWLRYREAKKTRGMSVVYDWFDWLGGYPFEVASPEAVSAFAERCGLRSEGLKTCGGGLGCNEFVFRK